MQNILSYKLFESEVSTLYREANVHAVVNACSRRSDDDFTSREIKEIDKTLNKLCFHNSGKIRYRSQIENIKLSDIGYTNLALNLFSDYNPNQLSTDSHLMKDEDKNFVHPEKWQPGYKQKNSIVKFDLKFCDFVNFKYKGDPKVHVTILKQVDEYYIVVIEYDYNDHNRFVRDRENIINGITNLYICDEIKGVLECLTEKLVNF